MATITAKYSIGESVYIINESQQRNVGLFVAYGEIESIIVERDKTFYNIQPFGSFEECNLFKDDVTNTGEFFKTISAKIKMNRIEYIAKHGIPNNNVM